LDWLRVDLPPAPHAGIATPVTLWGRAANGAVLAIDEIARAGGTVGYELMCALAARVPALVD
jgi:alanine racemase